MIFHVFSMLSQLKLSINKYISFAFIPITLNTSALFMIYNYTNVHIYIYITIPNHLRVLNVKIILCVVLHKEDKLYILNASLIVIFCKIFT